MVNTVRYPERRPDQWSCEPAQVRGSAVALSPNDHKDGRGDDPAGGGVMFVGIDVATAAVVVGVRPTGEGWSAANEAYPAADSIRHSRTLR